MPGVRVQLPKDALKGIMTKTEINFMITIGLLFILLRILFVWMARVVGDMMKGRES